MPLLSSSHSWQERNSEKSKKKTSRCSQQLRCKSHMTTATVKAGHVSSHQPKSFFHSSYFQCSQEQKRPAIKTLLKHFWCCQRPRGGVPGPNAEMLSPCSSSLPLSILWAGRCKMNNNLIWASKFYGAFSKWERWEVGLVLQHHHMTFTREPFKTF